MFKKHKLVLIKSDKTTTGVNRYVNNNYMVIDGKVSHLYLVSDFSPKKGDWTIYNNSKLHQCIENIIGDEFKKVVASTQGLKYTDLRVSPVQNFCFLPEIPSSFVHYFIDQYNKGWLIDHVMVECNEQACKCDTMEKAFDCCYAMGEQCRAPNPNNDFYGLFPKVNVDNTVNIQISKIEFTREEHIAGIKRMIQLYETTYLSGDIDKWILENL